MTSLSTNDSFSSFPKKTESFFEFDEPFQKSDYIAALFVCLVTFVLYVVTLCPNVALEDSGELITGAAVLGVPHPPGYPLWTMIGFLFAHLVPWGNIAWRVNLMSAVFGAAANGLLVLTMCHSSRWFTKTLRPEGDLFVERSVFYSALTAGLIIGFSSVMWSQAVIAEVFTLNAFILAAVLLCFYRWMAAPQKLNWLLASLFVFSLGLTHHHTLIFITPAFLIGVFLADRAFFPSFLTGLCLFALSTFAVLVWFSDDPNLQTICSRTSWGIFILIFGLSFWYTPKFSIQPFIRGAFLLASAWLTASYWMKDWFFMQSVSAWVLFFLALVTIGLLATSTLHFRFILLLLFLGWVGLLPYSYMSFASSTNPPMNWGYAREKSGFYHAVNRGQYQNNLASMIIKLLGPVTQVAPEGKSSSNILADIDYVASNIKAIKQYYRSLEGNFTLPICILPFFLLLSFRNLNSRQKHWLSFVFIAFVLLLIVQTMLDPPPFQDQITVWVIRRFFLQSHCLFALMSAYGLLFILLYFHERFPTLNDFFPNWKNNSPFPFWVLAFIPFISLLPLQQNVLVCSQYGHWFGWRYGTDLLQPLERNAVLFGGTDQGRFVPTYTIFCESQQPPQFKRDPHFDRRDVFIITQNALADLTYLNYIRDQYDFLHRPKTFSPLEKWLHRDTEYPQTSLHLPTNEEYYRCFIDFYHEIQKQRAAGQKPTIGGLNDIFDINGRVARLIFEANKKDHTFYIEQSIPMDWMYPYLIPSGLILKFNPEPLKDLAPEIVKTDREFWDHYEQSLLADPYFAYDPPAERSFSKLRGSIADLYVHRGLMDDAVYAYQQACRLGPLNEEITQNFATLLVNLHRYTEAEKLLEDAVATDPRNSSFQDFLKNVHQATEMEIEEKELRSSIDQDKDNYLLRQRLIGLLFREGKGDVILPEIEKIFALRQLPRQDVASYLQIVQNSNKPEENIQLLQIRLKVDPEDSNVHYNLAAIAHLRHRDEESFRELETALRYGRADVLQALQQDHRFDDLRSNPRFEKLISSK